PCRDREATPVRRAEIDERGRHLVDRPPADDSLLQPREQDEHREREDEGVEPELHDHDPVEEPHGRADADDHEDAVRRVPVRAETLCVRRHDEPRSDHRREAVDRLQGKVEAPRQQDERLGDDDEAECGGELCRVREVGRREEGRAREETDHEEHGERRKERKFANGAEQHAARRPPGDFAVLDHHVAHAAGSNPSAAAISSWRSHGGSRISLTTEPRCTTRTRVQIRSSSRSSDTSSTAVPSARASSITSRSASFEATSTPTVGLTTTSRPGRDASARPTTTFCWFPPLSSATGWSGPLETTWSRSLSALAASCRRAAETTPKRESRWRIESVRFSSTPSVGTKPRACRSSGT